MPTQVIMPKVDMDQEKATIIAWEKNEGDQVKQDETLLTVETEKVAIEVNSPAGGMLAGIRFKPGDVVPVATVIAHILQPGEALPGSPAPVPQAEAQKPAVGTASAQPPAHEAQASPLAQKVARELGVDLQQVPSAKGRITREDVEAYAASIENTPDHPETEKIPATPAARRISRETGIALEGLKGSGPQGRIQAADVKPGSTALPQKAGDREADLVPLAGIRAAIAQRMQSSFQNAPHIAETVHVDVSRLVDTKKHLNLIAAEKGMGKVTMTAILVKLVAWALERNPYLNSSLVEDQIHLWKEINIGIATALENGLIVPVVRNANQLTFLEMAERINDLGERARLGKLTLAEVQRGTFTISNLGMFGIDQFRAIINPPESAILAVGAAERKPIVIDDRDTVAVRPVISFTLSADHRVIDGVVAAKFLRDLANVAQHPEILLA